jgi:hypothetical protein
MNKFNFVIHPRGGGKPRPKAKEAETEPRISFAEFYVKFKAFCLRKKQRAAGNYEEDVDIDSDIPEEVAKEIQQDLAQHSPL